MKWMCIDIETLPQGARDWRAMQEAGDFDAAAAFLSQLEERAEAEGAMPAAPERKPVPRNLRDPAKIEAILLRGAAKARAIATPFMAGVRHAVGLRNLGSTDTGKKAKAVMEAGALVSDDIVLGMLEERLTAGDTGNGFILDGYPRNLAQANALDALLARLGQPVDIAVQLDVDTELLIGRLAGRAQAEGRADDSPDAVRKRLAVYEEATAPVVDFYRNSGRLACVDGVGAVDVVLQRILAALAPTPEVG